MVVVAAGREEEIECRTVVYKGHHRRDVKRVTKSYTRPNPEVLSNLLSSEVTHPCGSGVRPVPFTSHGSE